jgi:hypothetical protein
VDGDDFAASSAERHTAGGARGDAHVRKVLSASARFRRSAGGGPEH